MSPEGSPTGDGSFARPWDLATALNGPPEVTPGSTIWLRGGTYTDGPYFEHGYLSNLTGTADAPIVVRQFPGERATVTKFLFVRGGHTWYWGFEVVHPAPHVGNVYGVDVGAPGIKLINLVVHDASASGIYLRPEATAAEVYGTIAYNNGRTDNRDHGIYCKSGGSVLVGDNIVFDNWSYGIHCFADDGPYLQNIRLEGNVSFNNSAWGGTPGADLLIGGHFPATGAVIRDNYTYRTDFTNTMIAEVGHGGYANQDLVFSDNYLVGGWSFVGLWAAATVTGNTLYNFTRGGMVWSNGDLAGHTWSGNVFLGDSTAQAWRHDSSSVIAFDAWRTVTALANPGTYADSLPAGVKVVVRPNQYEPGRAHIIVYNWENRSSVGVDVSGSLRVGDQYLVRHAQDFFGPPVAAGTYTGDLLELPMMSVSAPTPLGTGMGPAPVTGPTFNLFVLIMTPRGRSLRGAGSLGPGAAEPGGDRVDVDLDVASTLSGQVLVRDWTVVRADGSVGKLTVSPTDSATSITAFRDSSGVCADPTRGVEFDGVGRVNTGGDLDPSRTELYAFTVQACDEGPAGSGQDLLRISVPDVGYLRGKEALSSGDLVKYSS